MNLSIIDIDWIVKKNNRLLKSRYRLSKYRSIGLDYRLDWIGLASLIVTYNIMSPYNVTICRDTLYNRKS